MLKSKTAPKYILADDFTGANDVGVALALNGVTTNVSLTDVDFCNGNDDTYILCSNSRDLSIDDAKARIRGLAETYNLSESESLLIKKVDSTLRGNVGGEIEALLNSGYSLAIVAIAAPHFQRKTVNGNCYVNNIPLSETEFASDPKSPIKSSRIKEILSKQTSLPIREYTEIGQDNQVICDSFMQLYDLGCKIIVCDAETYDDLRSLYTASSSIDIPTVFVTTGEITTIFTDENRKQIKSVPLSNMPLLAVIGSMSATTLQQTDALLSQSNTESIDLSINNLCPGESDKYLDQITNQAVSIIESGRHCIIRSCKDPALRNELSAIAERFELTQLQLAELVRDSLAELTNRIVHALPAPSKISGLLLCGGDIAIAAAERLGAPSYQLCGIMAGCVPWGYLNSSLTTFPVFTKAGGFGDETTFLQIVQHMKQEVK